MNGVYVYCFTPPGHLPGPDLAGFGPDSVSGVPLIGLTLWVERLESCPVASVEATLRHHAVVENAWTHAPACLPVRFGQWFRSTDLLEDSVRERQSDLEAALARVSGAGEHGLRIVDPEETERPPQAREETPRPSSGRAYLEGIRERVRRQELRELRGQSVAEGLEAALQGCIRAQRADPLPAEHGLVTVAHLVGREQEEEYGRRIAAFRRQHVGLSFVATGPWPPYSFAP